MKWATSPRRNSLDWCNMRRWNSSLPYCKLYRAARKAALLCYMIRHVKSEDAAAICSINNYHKLNTVVTFEEEPVSPEEMQSRNATNTARNPKQKNEHEGKVAAYAYA